MDSLRCKLLLREELNRLGIQPASIELGVVELHKDITSEQRAILKEVLLRSGLEVLDDKRSILIERIKNVVMELVHYSDGSRTIQLKYDYTYLSNIFSEVNGVTIQQFIILNKIERVKELLLYDELNLTEIAYKLQYSSVAHCQINSKK